MLKVGSVRHGPEGCPVFGGHGTYWRCVMNAPPPVRRPGKGRRWRAIRGRASRQKRLRSTSSPDPGWATGPSIR